MNTKQIDALKLSLEALEIATTPLAKDRQEVLRARTAIREALAEQPAQQQAPEYKGWYCAHCQRGVDSSEVTYHEQHTVCGRVITDDVPPKAQRQEPVAWRHDMGEENGGWEYFEEASCPECQPLYTSPPASKPWVGLVMGELPEDGHNNDFLRGAFWAEAKLREKNA